MAKTYVIDFIDMSVPFQPIIGNMTETSIDAALTAAEEGKKDLALEGYNNVGFEIFDHESGICLISRK